MRWEHEPYLPVQGTRLAEMQLAVTLWLDVHETALPQPFQSLQGPTQVH